MSLAVLADHMASKGRGPDSMLIHMSPREVQGLQALAMKHGGSLTINPDTGLPEAGFLDKLLPTIIGAGISFFSGGTIDPMTAAAIVGGVQTARTGDIGKGISAGLGAYGGASLTGTLTSAGTSALSGEATTLAADEAARLAGEEAVRNGIANNYTPEMLEAAKREAIDAAGSNTARVATDASNWDKLSAGAKSAANNPLAALKANATPLMMAAGPAILAEMGAKQNMPQTVTKPGMIRPYTYDPYGGGFTAGNPYEAQVKRAASGGIMGFDESANSPMSRNNMENMGNTGGMFNFAHDGGGVMRMAEGGIAGYAAGGPLDVNNPIYQYFAKPETQALLSSGNDKAIADALAANKWSLSDVANATGTQDRMADYANRFVKAEASPTTDASEFMAATSAVGLQNQALADALKNNNYSASAQYALTHNLNDAAGLGSTNVAGKPFYDAYGYTAGSAPGDQGGLEGLYSNINYAASGLQNQINSGALTVDQAQRLADAEMRRIGVSMGDVKAATGKDLFSLFTPKTVVTKDTITGGSGNDTITGATGNDAIIDYKSCPTGYHWDKAQQACVPNTSATQNTTTAVDTSTGLITAPDTSLPVGVSGTTGPSILGGGATVNANGTITTSPVIPGIPVGGFTGMADVRNAYTKGGGSLGYTPYTPKTIDEFNTKYGSKLTGGSKQAYDYLTGKTPYSPTPYTPTGEVMKPYAESVLGIPSNPSKKMYLFDPATKQYKLNPDYAIPTYDKDGKVSYALTNKDVSSFMAKNPSTDAFYTWATTNNLSPEQIATASGKPISEVSKLFASAKDLIGEDGKIDPTKLAEKTTADEQANFDYAAYLKANPDVQAELDAGKANFGTKDDLAAAAWNHYLTYGKPQGRTYTKKAAGGGLAALTMANGGMAAGGQFDLGGYSDGGRLLRGPGDGVSDSIPATIGNKRPARLADGEFVVPARIVSELGNGSTEAGARKLYAMMDRVQAARKGSIGKDKVAKNSRADKYLPA